MLGELPIAEDVVRVGVVTFSTTASVQSTFDTHASVSALRTVVRALPYEGGVTNAHLAIQQVRGMLSAQHGFRSSSAQLALLLVTDGSPSQPAQFDAEVAALASVVTSNRYVITVGASIPSQLLSFAGSSANVFQAANFSSLSAQRENVLNTFCTSNCPLGQFEIQPCTQFADHACSPLTVCNASEYEVIPPSRSSDRRCAPVTECVDDRPSPQQFEIAASTATSDRVCAAIVQCGSDEFESRAPTPTSNRVCIAIQSCIAAVSFESAPFSPSTDRQCTSCTQCSSTQFQQTQCTIVSDRVCNQLQTCTGGQFEAVLPTATTDRVCQAHTVCDTNFQFESIAPTPTTDRSCGFVSLCGSNEYVAVNETATSNRVCAACTQCGAGQYSSSSCTEFSDATCSSCTQTCVANPIDLVFMVDDSQSIENPIYGGQVRLFSS